MATAKKITKKVAKQVEATAEMPSASEVRVYSVAGKEVASMALPAELFGVRPNLDLVHQVTTAIAANKRQNRAHTKDRAEVAGGGKKPWKQKGTGQARHGSNRSPIWRHGGTTFGPRTERDYSEKLNRKMRAGALKSALSMKAADREVILLDALTLAAPKTSAAKAALVALGKAAGADVATKRKNAALIALVGYEESVVKSFRNIGSVKTEEVRNLNPLDVLTYKYLIIASPEAAFKQLSARTK